TNRHLKDGRERVPHFISSFEARHQPADMCLDANLSWHDEWIESERNMAIVSNRKEQEIIFGRVEQASELIATSWVNDEERIIFSTPDGQRLFVPELGQVIDAEIRFPRTW